MKRISMIFLQGVIVALGFAVLAAMIRLPMLEGRAAHLDLFHIYADPFLVYGYLASIAFFVALYQAFKFLGYVGQNKTSSPHSVKAIKIIKRCAIVLSISIVLAGVYIRIFHAADDDPAGFLALCIGATFLSVLVATAADVFERRLQKEGFGHKQ